MTRVVIAAGRRYPTPTTSNAALIEALQARGADTAVARWNVDPIDAFLDADAVLLRQTWDYQDDAAGFAAWISGLTLRGARVLNPAPVAIWNNDKRSLVELAGGGVVIPPTTGIENGEVAAAADKIGGTRFVVKPAYGGSGVGVRAAEREGLEAALAAAQAEAPGRPFMLQAYLPEIADGEWSLCFFGGAFSHAVLGRPAAGEFRVNSRYGAQRELLEPPAPALSAAQTMLDRLSSDLVYARIDGVMRGDQFICTELELTDPELHLDLAPGSADRFASAVLERLGPTQRPQTPRPRGD